MVDSASVRPESTSSWRISLTNASPSNAILNPRARRPAPDEQRVDEITLAEVWLSTQATRPRLVGYGAGAVTGGTRSGFPVAVRSCSSSLPQIRT